MYVFAARAWPVYGAGPGSGLVVRRAALECCQWMAVFTRSFKILLQRQSDIGSRTTCKVIPLVYLDGARTCAHAIAAPFHQLVAPSTKTTTIASLTTVLQMTLYRPIVLM
jgi:hypothetical protein